MFQVKLWNIHCDRGSLINCCLSEIDISFDVDVLTVGEDGEPEGALVISRRCPSFGPIPVIVRAFSYSQYQAFRSSFSSPIGQEAPELTTSFPQLPETATPNEDFNATSHSFLVQDQNGATLVPVHLLFVLDDTEPEFTEGFVVFLEVPAAVGPSSITVSNSLVLINIKDNDRTLLITHYSFCNSLSERRDVFFLPGSC